MADIIYTDKILQIEKISPSCTISYSFTADGKTTEATISNQTGSGTYGFTPRSSVFGPLMSRSSSGVLTIIVSTDTETKKYDYTLKMEQSIKATFNGVQYTTSGIFNGKPISGLSTLDITAKVVGTYGSAQTLRVYDKNTKTVKFVKSIPAQKDLTETSVSINIGSITKDTIFTVELTEDRGTKTTTDVEVQNVQKYNPPSITGEADWNTSGQPILKYSTTIMNTVAGKVNVIDAIYINYTDSEGQSYRKKVTAASSTSGISLSGTFDSTKSYHITLEVYDSVDPNHKVGGFYIVNLIGNACIMDIGADGKTVTFFGTSPSVAEETSLQVIGDKISLGKTEGRRAEITDGGLDVYDGNLTIAHIGVGDVMDNTGTVKQNVYYTFGNISSDNTRGLLSFATGSGSLASGVSSFAEGYHTKATGRESHSAGISTEASGAAAYVNGYYTKASGDYSAAFGSFTEATSENQMVVGKYNTIDNDGNYFFIVGNGHDGARSNALGVRKDGDLEINGVSVNTLKSGLVYHCYNSTSQSSGTNNSYYTSLGCFKSKETGPLSSLLKPIDSNYYVKFAKAGVYNVQFRFAYACPTQYKRVEIAPFINEVRMAHYSVTRAAGNSNATLIDIVTYTLNIAANNVLRIKMAPVDATAINVTPMDICITALDYEGKYK